ncbi:MAG: hypothetical protein R6U17_02510 [Thermoplasmata archaeon]
MNAIASELGIDNPKSYRNKTELAKAIIPRSEEKRMEEDVEEKIVEEDLRDRIFFEGLKEVNALLKVCESTKISTDSFRENIEELMNVDHTVSAERIQEMIKNVLEDGDVILELNKKLKVLDKIVNTTHDKSLKKDMEDNIEFILIKSETGLYKEALEEVERALDYLKNQKQSIGDKKSELELKINGTKKKLSELRYSGLALDDIKVLFKEGINAYKDGKIELGLRKINEALYRCHMLEDVYESLKEGRQLLKLMKEKDIAFQLYLDILKIGKNSADRGEYETAIEIVNDAISEMRQELGNMD